MNEYDLDTMAEDEPESRPRKPRWVRVLTRTLIGCSALVALLIVLAIALYEFGGMSGSVHPELLAQYQQMVAAGKEPPIQKRFVIPIPGCRCHSTDAALTAQHQRYRMSECNRCHDTNPAHMEPGV